MLILKILMVLFLTNAMAESNNNYIQTLINIGYGYTNFKRLRKRILYMSSKNKSEINFTQNKLFKRHYKITKKKPVIF